MRVTESSKNFVLGFECEAPLSSNSPQIVYSSQPFEYHANQ